MAFRRLRVYTRLSPTEPFRCIFPLRDGPNDSLLPSASPGRLQSSPAPSVFQTPPRPGGVFVRFPTTRAGVTPWEPAAARSCPPWLRRAAASGSFPPGATNSAGRASKRRVASTPIMEEPRTELCQLERTLGIRMERIQAIAICRRRVGFGVALIACHRLPSAEWFSSQENSRKRRQAPDVSPNIERRANSPLDRLGRSFENVRSRREQLV